ncbi:DUF2069 domain-containing protein [Stenoxybacter acetivorans]|uniref:DUF2069 domain-containing protein n=1 Tax=Stenoxybacter acetivorans TaxID=422441 RepID=UPI000565FA13|nr:DUF2069 domain-containing protein [Stenoxybacter acetivorans]
MVKQQILQKMALSAWLALLLVNLGWEWLFAPLRAGGSWLLLLKVVPLLLPLAGLLKNKIYTYQYCSLLVLFYVAEGVVRLFDNNINSRICAAASFVCAAAFFILDLWYLSARRKACV